MKGERFSEIKDIASIKYYDKQRPAWKEKEVIIDVAEKKYEAAERLYSPVYALIHNHFSTVEERFDFGLSKATSGNQTMLKQAETLRNSEVESAEKKYNYIEGREKQKFNFILNIIVSHYLDTCRSYIEQI